MDKKDFRGWIKVKEKLHYSNSTPRITEGDIWWCSCGENVGVEINGKNKLFSRPVLVYKKLSRYGFIGVPLTSQVKMGTWYVNFDFQNKRSRAGLLKINIPNSIELGRGYSRIYLNFNKNMVGCQLLIWQHNHKQGVGG